MEVKQNENYESPVTRRTQVSLEEGFMKASVVDKDEPVEKPNDNVDAGDQQIGGNYDFTGNSWD